MTPLSSKKRKTFFVIAIIIFIVAIPVVIMHARGFRFDSALGIFKSGGLFIFNDYSGSEIYIDGKFFRKTGIIQKNILVDNLFPGKYAVEVKKDGFNVWQSVLEVYPEVVTQAKAFVLPEDIEKIEIPEFVDERGSATTSKKIENKDYIESVSLFSATSTLVVYKDPRTNATSTKIRIERDILLELKNDMLIAYFTDDIDDAPFFLCIFDECIKQYEILNSTDIGSFEFYPGNNDVVVVSYDNKVSVFQIDVRDYILPQNIFIGNKPDFRLIDNSRMLVLDGKELYLIEL